ncbi:hypothetical protein L2E82_13063 [Cichorium intybus]|uniref:Uncharacterized protein n=1 Tax=Cichorium intybus TaxID=13427 RepID=A0ACB9GIU0_CICIN|nr:hypothetical protein L2E82_13063 [Cichorium intybus]
MPISPVKMLAGREGNYSERSKFTSADRCHISSRYLPVNGPSVIDMMTSCAYVSQFSADGTLFVAGFLDSDIKIYNVDNAWKVQKNIHARSFRWTITDTSLHLTNVSLAVGFSSTSSTAIDQTRGDKDQEQFTKQLSYYLAAFAGGIQISVLRDYARETLALLWRSWMTKYYMERYLKNQTFYQIQS